MGDKKHLEQINGGRRKIIKGIAATGALTALGGLGIGSAWAQSEPMKIGIIGTGKIGQILARIMCGIGCNVIGYDKYPNDAFKEAGGQYVDLHVLYEQSDIISLHCPLTYETYHIINEYAISAMKPGVMIINTSRGPLIDTAAVIGGLKKGKVGQLGLDVYEEEGELFFEDLSEQVIQDDTFVRLQTFPNVLITAHQAFFTREAIHNIAETTLENIQEYFKTGNCRNAVFPRD